MPYIWIALLAMVSSSPEPVDVKGTVCRLNRNSDRLIVRADEGQRMKVALGDSTIVTWEKASYRPEDLRLGDRVRISGIPAEFRVEANSVDVQMKVGETIVDALLGVKPPLVGRFGSQEASTEYFSLELPDGNYVRVEAKSAYGPKGRVWVSTLNSNDLLELSGSWESDDLYHASGIRVLTNEESSKCRRPEGETKESKAVRQAAEQRFLDGYMSDEEVLKKAREAEAVEEVVKEEEAKVEEVEADEVHAEQAKDEDATDEEAEDEEEQTEQEPQPKKPPAPVPPR